jgi:hypothetical protein
VLDAVSVADVVGLRQQSDDAGSGLAVDAFGEVLADALQARSPSSSASRSAGIAPA